MKFLADESIEKPVIDWLRGQNFDVRYITEILEGSPNITPAQFYDALSHYYDYKEQIKKEIRAEDLPGIERNLT